MSPSTVGTVSASATSAISWLNPTPHRLAVYASNAPLPVALATLTTGRLDGPYPGGSFPRLIALASPSARRLGPESAVRQVRPPRGQRPDELHPGHLAQRVLQLVGRTNDGVV